MNFKLFFTIVLGLCSSLSGCVNSVPNSNFELSRKKHALLSQGYSAPYAAAYVEGCKLGRSASGGQYSGIAGNAEAWQAGYDTCREIFLEELQQKNYNAEENSNKKASKDYGFTERQQLIWEQLRK